MPTRTATLKEPASLTAEQIARAKSVDPSGVKAYRAHPTGARAERIAELAAIVERLERVMSPSYIPIWLRQRLEALDNGRPLDLIAAGEHRLVAKIISAIEEPGAI